ncbi:MAG: Uma2 family endonuclease [Bryobacteraceae bacterium]|jgi:Uma2 family endonuclease
MVSMGTVKTLLTFEEFEQLPDQPGKQELVRGESIEMPPADLKHNRISHRIYKRMDAAIEQAPTRGEARDLGEAFHEMGYLLPGECWLQPDVSVAYARQTEGKYFEGAPAIAIEVISPSNTVKRIDAKAQLYFQFGAREVWRFFPKKKQVTIQVPGGVRVIAGDEVITTPLLPGLALAVKEIFGD